MVNPNGPLVEAGSDGDNGQTGRKLVMDFYGPRVVNPWKDDVVYDLLHRRRSRSG